MKIPPVKGGIRKLGILRPSDFMFYVVLLPQGQYSHKSLDSVIHHEGHEATRRLIQNLLNYFFVSFVNFVVKINGFMHETPL